MKNNQNLLKADVTISSCVVERNGDAYEITKVDAPFCKLAVRTEEQLTDGKFDFLSMVSEADRAELFAAFNTAQKKDYETFECTLTDSKGKKHSVCIMYRIFIGNSLLKLAIIDFTKAERNRSFISDLGLQNGYGVLRISSDEQGRYVIRYFNAACSRIMGYSEKELNRILQVNAYDVFHQQDLDAISAMVAGKTTNGETFNIRCRIITKEGANRTIYLTITVAIDESGKKYCIIVLQDINTYVLLLQEYEEINDTYQKILTDLPLPAFIVRADIDLKVICANPQFYKLMGVTNEEYYTKNQGIIGAYLGAEDTVVIREGLTEAMLRGEQFTYECKLSLPEERSIWIRAHAKLWKNQDGKPLFLITMEDITTARNRLLTLSMTASTIGNYGEFLDEKCIVYYVEDDTMRVMERGASEEMGVAVYNNYLSDFENLTSIYSKDRSNFIKLFSRACVVPKKGTIEFRRQTVSGDYNWYRLYYNSIEGKNGEVERIVGRYININDDKVASATLKEKLKTDELTGLMNKKAIQISVDNFLASEGKEGVHAFFVLDFDNFKLINDNFGHMFGDMVLQKLADKIKAIIESTATIIGRIGGDEFVIFMKNTTREKAVSKARKLCSGVIDTYTREDKTISISCSIGLAYYSEHGIDYASLFYRADKALYKSKASGKKCFSEFDNTLLLTKGNYYVNHNRTIGVSAAEPGADTIHFAFDIFYRAVDIDAAINQVLDNIGRQFGHDVILLFGNEGGRYVCRNAWGTGIARFNIADINYAAIDVDKFFNTDNTMFMQDCISRDNFIAQEASLRGLQSLFACCMPRVGNSELILVVLRREASTFSDNERYSIREFTKLLEVFIERDRLKRNG